MNGKRIINTIFILILYFLLRSVVQYIFMIRLPENIGVTILFPNVLANIMDVAIAVVLWRYGRKYFSHDRVGLKECGGFVLTEAVVFAVMFVYVKSGLESIWTNDVAGAAFDAAYPLLLRIGVYTDPTYGIFTDPVWSQMNATWNMCFPFGELDLLEAMLILCYTFVMRLISGVIGRMSGRAIIKST